MSCSELFVPTEGSLRSRRGQVKQLFSEIKRVHILQTFFLACFVMELREDTTWKCSPLLVLY